MDFSWVWVGLVLNFVLFFSLAWKKSVFGMFESSSSGVGSSGWAW